MLSVTFDVDHKVLERGVYLAKIDRVGNTAAITLDIRLRRPYREEIMSAVEMHTFEHVYATAIRTVMDPKADADVIYFGPMGCNTGFYLIFGMEYATEEELEEKVMRLPSYMLEAVDYLPKMPRVPAANEYQCGYCYTLGDMDLARRMGEELGEVLQTVTKNGYSKYVRLTEEQCRALEA